jgi:hypothetical protein
MFLLVAFRNFLERNRPFTVRMDSTVRDFDVRDRFVGPS